MDNMAPLLSILKEEEIMLEQMAILELREELEKLRREVEMLREEVGELSTRPKIKARHEGNMDEAFFNAAMDLLSRIKEPMDMDARREAFKEKWRLG
jgi:hypothetical protein